MKDTVFAAIVCKKCSAEQLHADGLTKVKGADILPWSAEDIAKPKEVVLKKTFWEMRAASQANITTEHGIYLRMCRSIQVEGAFGLLKNDFGFRRFLTRGKANIRTELFFLALAYDLKKLWMKRENGRLKTHLSEIAVA